MRGWAGKQVTIAGVEVGAAIQLLVHDALTFTADEFRGQMALIGAQLSVSAFSWLIDYHHQPPLSATRHPPHRRTITRK